LQTNEKEVPTKGGNESQAPPIRKPVPADKAAKETLTEKLKKNKDQTGAGAAATREKTTSAQPSEAVTKIDSNDPAIKKERNEISHDDVVLNASDSIPKNTPIESAQTTGVDTGML
jgi:hypothetical protein